MGSGKDGIFVTGKDTVTIFYRLVRAGYQGFVFSEQLLYTFLEFCIDDRFFRLLIKNIFHVLGKQGLFLIEELNKVIG